MDLPGEEKHLLHEALCSAFPTVQSLREMVLYRCNQQLDVFTDGPLGARVFQLIQDADARNWISRLVAGAHAYNHDNERLKTFYRRFTTAPHRRASPASLERIVKKSKCFLDVVLLREALERAEKQVCRVLVKGAVSGTGFLVAPDVVVTNEHVVGESRGPDISLEFDCKVLASGGAVAPGRPYHVVEVIESKPASAADNVAFPKAIEATIDELDYAFLRVEGKPGDEIVGENARGWVDVPEAGQLLVPGGDLIIVQHPGGGPMKVAFDEVIAVNAPGTRVTYTTNTEPGSSGSPCFDAEWRVVAIHHSGDPRGQVNAGYNEGIPLTTIRAHLRPATKGALGWA